MTFADQGDDPAVKKEGRSGKEAGGQKLQTLKSSLISEAILSAGQFYQQGNFITEGSRQKTLQDFRPPFISDTDKSQKCIF